MDFTHLDLAPFGIDTFIWLVLSLILFVIAITAELKCSLVVTDCKDAAMNTYIITSVV